MTLKQTKEKLIELVSDSKLKVIAFSGAWGTGKTYLWEEICRDSTDKAIHESRYVSLFGVRDINQLKLKVVQSLLPDVARSNLVTEGIHTALKTAKDALTKVHPSFAALDELALIAVPAALRNQFVVIDDLERKHSALTVDEVLGFVDEYAERFGTRFLLILNSEKLSGDQDDTLWATLREKVVDEELRFSPTPLEAFDIAIPSLNAHYRASVRDAVEACGLTNIRVIRHAHRLVVRLLGTTPELIAPIQARTVPSIVLVSATHNRAIKGGPDMDFIVGYNRSDGRWLKQYLSGKQSNTDESPEHDTPAAWKLLMSNLKINSADEFEELVVAYVREGRHEAEEIEKVIEGYKANHSRLAAQTAARALVESIRWDVNISDEEPLSEATRLVSLIGELDAYSVSVLHELVSSLENGIPVAEKMLDAWIAHFEGIKGSAEFAEWSFDRPLHPRVKDAIDTARNERIQSGTLVETILWLAERDSWGHKEEATLRVATIEDFLTAMRTLKGQEFKRFILKSLDILEHGQTYENHFGNAGRNFLEAARRIMSTEGSPRFKSLLYKLFADSKVPTALKPNMSTGIDLT